MKSALILPLLVVSFFAANSQPRLILPVSHSKEIQQVIYTADGNYVITGAHDGMVDLWEAGSGRLVYQVEAGDEVTALTVSPDGKQIIAGLNNSDIKIWEMISGKLMHTLNGEQTDITGFEFNKTGSLMMSTSYFRDGRCAVVWNVKTWEEEFALKYSYSTTFSPDGSMIVMACLDKTVKFLDIASGELKFELSDFKRLATSVEFSPDGKLLAAGTLNKVEIWDPQSKQRLNLTGNEDEIRSFEFSPDSKFLTIEHGEVQGSYSPYCTIWDVATGNLIHTLKHPTSSIDVSNPKFSPEAQTVLTSGEDRAMLWDRTSGKLLQEYKVDEKLIDPFIAYAKMTLTSSFDRYLMHNAFFSPDGQSVICHSDGAATPIWSTKDGKLKQRLAGHVNRINEKLLGANGKYFFTYAGNSTAKLWDAATCKITMSFPYDVIYWSTFDASGEHLLIANANQIDVWSCGGKKIVGTIELFSDPEDRSLMDGIAFSPGGKYVAITYFDYPAQRIRLYDFETGRLLRTINPPGDDPSDFKFTEDENFLIASDRKTADVTVWDVQSGKLINTLKGTSPVLAIDYDPVTQTVAGATDSTICVWDVKTGTLLHKMAGDAKTTGVLFGQKGHLLVSYGGNKEQAKVWDTRTGQLIRELPFEGYYQSIHITPNESAVVINSTKTIDVWETGTWTVKNKINLNKHNDVSLSDDGRHIYAATDNEIKIFSLLKSEAVLSILPIDEKDYLVYDNSFRFDGSEGARGLLYFSCGTEIVELKQLKDQLWVPDLAERTLKGEAITGTSLSQIEICDFIPVVKSLPMVGDNFVYQITQRKGELGQAALLVNGLEVKRYELKNLKKTTQGYLLQVPKSELTQYFIGGQENRVSLKAYSKGNGISSRGESTPVPFDAGASQPALFAVIVGISDYKGDDIDLKFAAKDAQDFHAALKASASKFFNFDGAERTHLYLAHTGKDRQYFPNKPEIKSIFEDIAKKAKSRDVLLIFFAGHGITDAETQQFYFLTADASSMSAAANGGISSRELMEWTQPAKIKAQKRILILDACKSGQAVKDLVKVGTADQSLVVARDDQAGRFVKAIDKLNERSGLFILSASSSKQSAYEVEALNQGVLTYSLLKSIKEDPHVLDQSQFLNLNGWFEAVEKNVAELSLTYDINQNPQIVRTTNFNIGVVDDEVRSVITLPSKRRVFGSSNFQDETSLVDDLSLNQKLDEQLRALASAGENNISFYTGAVTQDAFQINGRYNVTNNESLSVVVVVRKGKTIITRFEVTGKTTDVGALANEISLRVLKSLE